MDRPEWTPLRGRDGRRRLALRGGGDGVVLSDTLYVTGLPPFANEVLVPTSPWGGIKSPLQYSGFALEAAEIRQHVVHNQGTRQRGFDPPVGAGGLLKFIGHNVLAKWF